MAAERGSSRLRRISAFTSAWVWRGADGARSVDLDRLRFAFLVFGVVNSLTLTAMVIGEARSLTLALLGSGSALTLAAYWIYGYRHRFLWALDVCEAALMFVAAFCVGEAERALGIFYVGNFLRSLYDGPRRAMTRVFLYWLALSAAIISTPSSMPTSGRLVPHLIGFLFTGPVMQLIAITVKHHVRALARERILRSLAVQLTDLRSDDEIYLAAVDAVLALGEDDATARAGIALGGIDRMDVVAARGADAEAVAGGWVTPAAFPASVLNDLADGRTTKWDRTDGEEPPADASFVPKPHMMIVPLRVGRELRGLMVYGSESGLEPDLSDVLSALGSQLSVWMARRASDDVVKRTEERYRALVQNATDIVALVDDTASIVYVSPSVESIMGYSPDEIIGMNGFGFADPDEVAEIGELFVSCLVDPSVRPRGEFRAYAADGSLRWMEIRLTNHLQTESLGSIVVNARDVTDQRRIAEEREQHQIFLDATSRERARLVRHLVAAQEDERKVIAGDIHDDSVQKMSAAAIRLGMLRRHIQDPQGLAVLTKVESSVSEAIDRLRKLMFSLRPPTLDRDGLAAALREYLVATSEECGFEFTFEASLDCEPSSEIGVTAFRIAQEALTNVRKHAHATIVSVTMTNQEDGIRISITDDGGGFGPDALTASSKGHLGMTSMRERAELSGGWLNVSSEPGIGTSVEYFVRNPNIDDQELSAVDDAA
jgi:PAS domain S-box-containing protein